MLSTKLLWFLLYFAQQYSGYALPANAPLPSIRLATAQELNRKQVEHQDWYAQTVTSTGEMILSQTPKADNAEDVCAIAHEMTHYLQTLNNFHATNSTNANLEIPAYAVGAKCYTILFHDPDGALWSLQQSIHFLIKDFKR